MLSQVEITSQKGTQLVLPFRDVSDGFFTKDITGLDPVPVTFISSTAAQLEGETYQAATRGKRNIVLKLVLEPDYVDTTVDGMRQTLYDFFMPKSVVQMRYVFDNKEPVTIEGRVESMFSPPFVQEPFADISLVCFKPDFVSLSLIAYSGVSTAGFDDLSIEYIGSSDAPFVFKLTPSRALDEFMIYHTRPDGFVEALRIEYPLIAGDELLLDTTPGENGKLLTLTRGGFVDSILFAKEPGSPWLQLRPGTNLFRISAVGDPVPYTFEYRNLYGGV